MSDLESVNGIVVMGSWNTDGGVSRHTTPLVEWLRSQGYKVKVFTHYRKTPHGMQLNVKDEDFVTRCYTTEGKQVHGLNSFDSKPLLNAIEQEGYNIFLAEDLGMLPMKELLEVFPRIKEKAQTILLNHDNEPKPNDSIFWKFNWDAVINFLPSQNEFMVKHYPAEKVYLSSFPCYPVLNMKKKESHESLDLPTDKKIILVFGEYNFIAPFNALYRLREEDPSTYLVALVYTEDMKDILESRLKERGFDKGYDEIRVEKSSWQRRAKYVSASQLIVLDKGKVTIGKGAIISSTAFQIIGWRTPILASDNFWFRLFGDAILRFTSNEELTEQAKLLLNDSHTRGEVISHALAFAYSHSPERVSSQILYIFQRCLSSSKYRKLSRFRGNPILKARPIYINIRDHRLYWEKLVYNAAAVRINGITYLLYRALGEDGISRIGLWWSGNGYHQDGRLLFPIFGPREDYELPRATKKRREEHRKLYGMVREVGGTEDPRVTLIGDTLYMTYTAYGDMVQLAMAKIEVGDFLKGIKECNSYEEWNSLWVRNGPVFKALGDKDAVLFPVEEHKVQQHQISSRKGRNKFVTLFPELLEGKFALIHRIPPDMQILYTEELRNVGPSVGKTFFMSRPGMWDGEKVGAGAPPLRTKYGWLHIYHGVGKRNDKKVYRLGAILTSFDDPARILYASHIPVLEPEEDYEVNGWVPNIVFTCGVVPKYKDSNETLDENDKIMVYYGAADKVMGVAEAKIGELIPKELRE